MKPFYTNDALLIVGHLYLCASILIDDINKKLALGLLGLCAIVAMPFMGGK
jgi:hypothetical protein